MDKFFEIAPFFLTRKAFFASEVFTRISEMPGEKTLSVFRDSEAVREAILIASYPLYQSLQKFETLSEKARQQALSSLHKYLLRMGSRATPFGLFAQVSIGHFDSASAPQTETIKKHARPDMEWVMQLLKILLTDKDSLRPLSLKKNPLILMKNDRVYLPYSHKKKEKEKEISVRHSALVQSILRFSSSPITFDALVKSVVEESPDLEADKVGDVVFQLFEKDFLFPSIYPDILSEDPFGEITAKLKAIGHQETAYFEEIQTKIKVYNQSPVGQGESLLKALIEEMSEKVETKNCLQVDSSSTLSATLPPSIQQDLAEVTSLLWSISKKGLSPIEKYRQKFLDKYGFSRLVPLEELLHPSLGLGFAEKGEETEKKEEDREIFEMVATAIMEGKQEIELDEAFFKKRKHSAPLMFAPRSFDLYFELLQKSGDGDYSLLLQPTMGAGEGGATLGRFLPFLGGGIKEEMTRFLEKEEKNSPSTQFVESSFFPSGARTANVAINPLLRSDSLNLGYGQKPGLSLEDLYVGATEDFLYLTTKEGKKRLHIGALNVVNPELAPPVLQFLRDISKDGSRFLLPFDWAAMYPFPYLPRVRYKRCIILPATWKVSLELLQETKKSSHDTLCKKLKAWIEKWQLPRFVLMTVADNRVLLDLNSPFHLREIAHVLRNKSSWSVHLTESLQTLKEGEKFTEYVACCTRTYQDKEELKLADLSDISLLEKTKVPLDEWIYLKLFLPVETEEAFLISSVTPFISEIYPRLEKWFFIRYIEQEKGLIRLRLKPKQTELLPLLENMQKWARQNLMEGKLQDLSIGTYEKETERYGGVEAIEHAESFFSADSELALGIISHLESEDQPLPAYAFVALSILEILQGLGLNLAQQAEFFKEVGIDRKYLEGFKKHQKTLIESAEKLFVSQEGMLPGPSLDALKQAYVKMGAPSGVIRSLLHMHCNRVMGISNEIEFKSYAYCGKILSILSQKLQLAGR